MIRFRGSSRVGAAAAAAARVSLDRCCRPMREMERFRAVAGLLVPFDDGGFSGETMDRELSLGGLLDGLDDESRR